jgi:hypothetical protein
LFTAESAESAEERLDGSYHDAVARLRVPEFRLQEFLPTPVKSCAPDFFALFTVSAVSNLG